MSIDAAWEDGPPRYEAPAIDAIDPPRCARAMEPRGLPRALSEQHHAHGFEQDHEVEQEAVVLHVIQVVFQLLDRLLDRRAVRVSHLRPAGEARLAAVARGVERDLLG